MPKEAHVLVGIERAASVAEPNWLYLMREVGAKIFAVASALTPPTKFHKQQPFQRTFVFAASRILHHGLVKALSVAWLLWLYRTQFRQWARLSVKQRIRRHLWQFSRPLEAAIVVLALKQQHPQAIATHRQAVVLGVHQAKNEDVSDFFSHFLKSTSDSLPVLFVVPVQK